MDTLPFDLKERILDSIASPHDLRSLASTAHPWAALIIPRHIQYRVLCLGPHSQHSSIWAHLAERKDLAKNIREIRLTDLRRKWERRPTALVPPLEEQSENEEEMSFLQAFRNFEQLESFTWRPHDRPSFMDPYRNPRFLEILNDAKHLNSLDLTKWDNPRDEKLHKWLPLFNFRELQRLHLRGLFWGSFTRGSALTSLLLRCPEIQDLSLFYNQSSPSFVECLFPRLRILYIQGTPGASQSDGDILEFFKAHKTIEELTWYPPPSVSILSGSLPALRKIASTHQFTISVLQDKSVPNRALTGIGHLSINSESMKILEGIQGTQVQELYVSHYDRIQDVHQLAELFPTITSLQILNFGTMTPLSEPKTLDDLVFTLSHFPALECIFGTKVCMFILDLEGNEARQDAIAKLAHACPNLRFMNSYGLLYGSITLHRDGERITWESDANDNDED